MESADDLARYRSLGTSIPCSWCAGVRARVFPENPSAHTGPKPGEADVGLPGAGHMKPTACSLIVSSRKTISRWVGVGRSVAVLHFDGLNLFFVRRSRAGYPGFDLSFIEG